MKVNKANMRLWVAGLRSGIFPQGRSKLKMIGSVDGIIRYCCLGVVCDIARIHGVEVQEEPWCGTGTLVINGSRHFLTGPVMAWLGLTGTRGDNPVVGVDPHGSTVCASTANDGLDWDFLQIADSIEAYYKLSEPDEEEEAGDTPQAD